MRIKPIRGALLVPVILAALGQQAAAPTAPTLVPLNATGVPFEVGERLTYSMKVSAFNAGTTVMSVDSAARIRGIPALHTVFDLKGRVLFKKFENHCESWVDTARVVSLREKQTINGETKSYEFFGERKVYVRDGQEFPSVAEPIEECAFLYYLRSVDFEVGKTYTIERYYHADKNPIVITVDRKERIKVAAGEFDAVLVRPVIKSNGLFSVAGEAEVWIGTEGSRPILRLKSKLSTGTLYLELKDIGPKL